MQILSVIPEQKIGKSQKASLSSNVCYYAFINQQVFLVTVIS